MEHVEVLVVGAGLSGIGAAARLELECPGTSYAVLEARESIGGTWDLFRFPGIRSDSDMHTLGYPFRPWLEGQSFADGPSILAYVRDTAREMGVEPKVRLQHRVVSADWSSDDARWTVQVARDDTGDQIALTCSFLYACTGYYRYDRGHEPAIPGLDTFDGPVVHPQRWPADLDVSHRRVVVIGSGATAVTLVPVLAQSAAHVVMLQRSPGYVISLPSRDPLAELARRHLSPERAYRLVRGKNIATSGLSYRLSMRWPQRMRSLLMRRVAAQLPEGYDVQQHFGPAYGPWTQRLCVAPDGDLFAAIRSGAASVVTGRIARIVPRGIELEDGELVEADVIVTATGLELQLMGGTQLAVDGVPVVASDCVTYKGLMLSGVPNFAFAVGYTNASWTLKCDLVSRYVCRLLEHMRSRGLDTVVPVPPPSDAREPLIGLTSGYVRRSLADLPTQGSRVPWRVHQSYRKDVALLARGPVDDEGVRFSRRARTGSEART